MAEMKVDLRGLISATFTPMCADGFRKLWLATPLTVQTTELHKAYCALLHRKSLCTTGPREVNIDAIDKYLDVLVEDGIESIFILGTTGEGCSLSVSERKLVAEKWLKVAKHRMKNIIIHVGTANLADTRDLAKHAEALGATAIATLPSLFFKPSDAKCLALYLAEVGKAAPKTPLLYYHIPIATGVQFKIKEVIDEIEKVGVPTFAGVKFTALDLCDLGQCIHHHGEKYSFSYGRDEQLCAALLLGAQSCVGSTFNYAAKLNHRIFNACMKDDVATAKKEQFKSQTYISYLQTIGLGVGLQKALMLPLKGIDLGPPRLPLLPTPQEKLDEIVEALKKMGFFEWNA